MEKTYRVHCSWLVSAVVDVKAENIQEAMDKVDNGDDYPQNFSPVGEIEIDKLATLCMNKNFDIGDKVKIIQQTDSFLHKHFIGLLGTVVKVDTCGNYFVNVSGRLIEFSTNELEFTE